MELKKSLISNLDWILGGGVYIKKFRTPISSLVQLNLVSDPFNC